MIEEVSFSAESETLVGCRYGVASAATPHLLFLHGGGPTSSKDSFRPLAICLMDRGISSFAFDFSGHGESSGSLGASSLAKRAAEARAALRLLAPSPVTSICAMSMGGHTALGLLGHVDFRRVVLFCPAVYSPRAEGLPFNEGFSDVIRDRNSWKEATVVETLRRFRGRLLLVRGAEDRVVPPEVATMIDENAPTTERKKIVTVPGLGHHVLERYYADPARMTSLANELARFLQQ